MPHAGHWWKEPADKDIVPAFREISEKDRQGDTIVQSAQLSQIGLDTELVRTDLIGNVLLQWEEGPV